MINPSYAITVTNYQLHVRDTTVKFTKVMPPYSIKCSVFSGKVAFAKLITHEHSTFLKPLWDKLSSSCLLTPS